MWEGENKNQNKTKTPVVSNICLLRFSLRWNSTVLLKTHCNEVSCKVWSGPYSRAITKSKSSHGNRKGGVIVSPPSFDSFWPINQWERDTGLTYVYLIVFIPNQKEISVNQPVILIPWKCQLSRIFVFSKHITDPILHVAIKERVISVCKCKSRGGDTQMKRSYVGARCLA